MENPFCLRWWFQPSGNERKITERKKERLEGLERTFHCETQLMELCQVVLELRQEHPQGEELSDTTSLPPLSYWLTLAFTNSPHLPPHTPFLLVS